MGQSQRGAQQRAPEQGPARAGNVATARTARTIGCGRRQRESPALIASTQPQRAAVSRRRRKRACARRGRCPGTASAAAASRHAPDATTGATTTPLAASPRIPGGSAANSGAGPPPREQGPAGSASRAAGLRACACRRVSGDGAAGCGTAVQGASRHGGGGAAGPDRRLRGDPAVAAAIALGLVTQTRQEADAVLVRSDASQPRSTRRTLWCSYPHIRVVAGADGFSDGARGVAAAGGPEVVESSQRRQRTCCRRRGLRAGRAFALARVDSSGSAGTSRPSAGQAERPGGDNRSGPAQPDAFARPRKRRLPRTASSDRVRWPRRIHRQAAALARGARECTRTPSPAPAVRARRRRQPSPLRCRCVPQKVLAARPAAGQSREGLLLSSARTPTPAAAKEKRAERGGQVRCGGGRTHGSRGRPWRASARTCAHAKRCTAGQSPHAVRMPSTAAESPRRRPQRWRRRREERLHVRRSVRGRAPAQRLRARAKSAMRRARQAHAHARAPGCVPAAPARAHQGVACVQKKKCGDGAAARDTPAEDRRSARSGAASCRPAFASASSFGYPA